MKKELKEKLIQDYPALFSGRGSPDCGDGWYTIVDGLCDILTNHIQYAIPEEIRDQVYVTQIKEKFGGLRFYMNHEDDFMTGAITMAEYISDRTCERCGLPGTKRTIGGWVLTLCDKDAELRKEENEQRRKEYEAKYKK